MRCALAILGLLFLVSCSDSNPPATQAPAENRTPIEEAIDRASEEDPGDPETARALLDEIGTEIDTHFSTYYLLLQSLKKVEQKRGLWKIERKYVHPWLMLFGTAGTIGGYVKAMRAERGPYADDIVKLFNDARREHVAKVIQWLETEAPRELEAAAKKARERTPGLKLAAVRKSRKDKIKQMITYLRGEKVNVATTLRGLRVLGGQASAFPIKEFTELGSAENEALRALRAGKDPGKVLPRFDEEVKKGIEFAKKRKKGWIILGVGLGTLVGWALIDEWGRSVLFETEEQVEDLKIEIAAARHDLRDAYSRFIELRARTAESLGEEILDEYEVDEEVEEALDGKSESENGHEKSEK